MVEGWGIVQPHFAVLSASGETVDGHLPIYIEKFSAGELLLPEFVCCRSKKALAPIEYVALPGAVLGSRIRYKDADGMK